MFSTVRNTPRAQAHIDVWDLYQQWREASVTGDEERHEDVFAIPSYMASRCERDPAQLAKRERMGMRKVDEP
jgi:hypothetical protein